MTTENSPTTPIATTSGHTGVRRSETMRREITIVRAAVSDVITTLGTSVNSSSVIACGNTSGGSAT